MANLFLTKTCRRNCRFCFAKEGPWSDAYPPRPLRLEEIEEFASLPNNENRPECGIVGGEPLLHPELVEVIERLNAHRIVPKIFTSGTCEFSPRLTEMDRQKFYFIVNAHPPESYCEEERRNMETFFRTFASRIKLGYTLLDPAYDPAFLLSYYRRFRLLPFFRVGMALPTVAGANEFVPRERYREAATAFLAFARRAAECGAAAGMDCGFVACMFTTRELGRLQACGVKLNFRCMPVLDIGPDLETWYCFPLSSMGRYSLREQGSIPEAYHRFEERAAGIRRRLSQGIYERCGRCRYFHRKQCDGGCLGLILRERGITREALAKL